MSLETLKIGDEVCVDRGSDDPRPDCKQRFGRIIALSRGLPPGYAIELSERVHEGTVEYDVKRESLCLACDVPCEVGEEVVLDAASDAPRFGKIHAIKRSFPAIQYVVDVAGTLEHDVPIERLTRGYNPEEAGSYCNVM